MDQILDTLLKLINNSRHLEGLILYCIGSISITIVHLKNLSEWKKGLKGDNGLWESPEITIYLWLWLFPHVIMSVLFLQYTPPTYFWYFMGACLLFSLLGRWGFEWLLSLRSIQVEKKSTTLEAGGATITTTEQKNTEPTPQPTKNE